MQILSVVIVGFAAFNGQQILLADDCNLVWGKPGDGYRDPVGVRTRPNDIVRWVTTLIFRELGIVQKIEQMVEADTRPLQGSKVEVPHSHILRLSNMGTSSASDTSADARTGPFSIRWQTELHPVRLTPA